MKHKILILSVLVSMGTCAVLLAMVLDLKVKHSSCQKKIMTLVTQMNSAALQIQKKPYVLVRMKKGESVLKGLSAPVDGVYKVELEKMMEVKK